MRKILGLALGATVLMMGYVEGMKLKPVKRPAEENFVAPDHPIKKQESGVTTSPSRPKGGPLSGQDVSPISVQSVMPSTRDALHGATRLLRTMLLNADKAIISKNESALRRAIDERVKSWCAALIAEVDGKKALLPVAEDLLCQEASRDAACLFEVGARILGVWDIYQTTWEQDNNLLPALAGLLRCAARHWEQPRARNTAAEVLVEKLTQGGLTTFSPMDKEFMSAAQDILFTAAEQVYDEDA